MPYLPRAERECERMRAAGAATGSAMDRALAQIGAAFGQAAAVNGFKLRVEQTLRRGPQHATVRARFGARAGMLNGRSLDAAVIMVERWWRDERKAFQIASVLGYGNRLSLETLRELRLILRVMRFRRMHAQFGAIAAALDDEPMPIAAE
ncbi:MAG: hypothetical protein WAL80_09995 [Xanthobacteraceae bacterium]|jgi:hypothetical protein